MFGLHYVSPSPPLSLSLRINILHVGESFYFCFFPQFCRLKGVFSELMQLYWQVSTRWCCKVNF